MKKQPTLCGILRTHPRGFGFVTPDDPSKSGDLFIPKRMMNWAVDGDYVEVTVSQTVSEKGPEGKIARILKRGRTHLAGTVVSTHKKSALVYAPLLGEDLVSVIDQKKALNPGDRIVIHILKWATPHKEALGEVAAYIGHISDPSCDMKAAVEEFELFDAFPEEVIEEAKAFGKEIPKNAPLERKDLRELTCITIDPATAKDFDDALSLEMDEKGFYLGVHIADVSYYVKRGSALDASARERCNSTYFPEGVLPMLPHTLSSHLCSLMPNVDRLAVSIFMRFDLEGELLDYQIERSVICSKHRFSYEDAKEVLDGNQKSAHAPLIHNLTKLCATLKKKRYQRGSIEFSLPSLKLQVDKEGAPLGVEMVEYDITHQLVEECMLQANEVVATHLNRQGKPLTYRIHEAPSEENLKEFAATATALGFPLSGAPDAEELQHFFDEARESPLGSFLAIAFIKSMKQAIYSTDNIGHYGLGLEYYTHFTSPIRRYIDLVVHRMLFEEESEEDFEKISSLCSEKERLSAKAETSVTLMKKLRLLGKQDPHQTFQAVITQVKPVGISFTVETLFLDGFLPLSALGRDFFTFNPQRKRLEGNRSLYQIGQHIALKLDTIDLFTQTAKWRLHFAKKTKRRFT